MYYYCVRFLTKGGTELRFIRKENGLLYTYEERSARRVALALVRSELCSIAWVWTCDSDGAKEVAMVDCFDRDDDGKVRRRSADELDWTAQP